MRLIVSAYRAGASPTENAVSTAALIRSVDAFAITLVQGCYNGVQEVAVMIEGFEDIGHLYNIAGKLCDWYGQTCVYYSVEGVSYLLHADGKHQTLGPERHYPVDMAHSPIFRSVYTNYTMLPDGSALAAHSPQHLRVAA